MTIERGIVLAGGAGTRLYPSTVAVCKQLLPVWDKPLVYYPINTLMLCGIREILVISSPNDVESFKRLLGDGSAYGISVQYATQAEPRGIAEAELIGEQFIDQKPHALILGDNLFHGPMELIRGPFQSFEQSTIFCYQVVDPERYGVVTFDHHGQATRIREKPDLPDSNWAITGLYLYDGDAPERTRRLRPSKRNELEISDVSNSYLADHKLSVRKLERGMAWLDTGTTESMQQASNFVEVLEKRQGLKIACLEETAFRMNYIDAAALHRRIAQLPDCSYRTYLQQLLG